jgi:very-short-patch-repair endonuclease
MSIEDRIFESLQTDLLCEIEHEVVALRKCCESEIEVMYGVAAKIILTLNWPGSFKLIPASREAEHRETAIVLMPQYPWQNYRIDWVWRLRSAPKDNFLFIECDGHDFHERTKEQAEHDRSKDRAIQKAGIPILRFTGREIFRDVSSCLTETIEFFARSREPSDG